MQTAALDVSTSDYLVVDGPDAGDSTRLRLHRNPLPAAGYKNKPPGPDRPRVLAYTLWDRATGAVRSRYTVARRESAALDVIEFLLWAFAPAADPRVVLHGVPEHLWVDQGPLVESKATRGLIERLAIGCSFGLPHQKTSMGGTEGSHRTRWSRFERALFLLPPHKQSLTLVELNVRLQDFEIEENQQPAPNSVDGVRLSRSATWIALSDRRPADRPLRRLPDNAMEALTMEAHRTIDRNGIVRWDNVPYLVKGWQDRKVIAYRAADGAGDIVVEDKLTGERRSARRYAPAPLERLGAEGVAAEQKGVGL